MNSRLLLVEAVRRLRAVEVEDAVLEARLLLARALGVRPDALLLDPDRPVPDAAAASFEQFLVRRLGREPLFYILGEREFFGLPFNVDRRALIPRPETELLVECALEIAKGRDPSLMIADIGTGSGLSLIHI